MLLTSWVESMRVAFEKSRKATLNPRRRLQLRSGPSTARQKVQRRIAVEQLEDRTLLTSLIINQITPGQGLTLNNSILDPDADGTSNYDTILFEDLTINASTGTGVSIDLDNLDFDEPFQILFDNVSIISTAGVGIDIELSNLDIDTIAVDSSTITGGVGNAFNVDLSNVILNEFNVIDSTLAGQAGAGLTLGLSASTVEETSLRRSTIDGVAIDALDDSHLNHTTMADNLISGNTGNDGVSVNVVDSEAEEFRLTNNIGIQGVSITVDDTSEGDAALLTELFIQDNIINGNQVGDGIHLDLNNVDLFASITGNFIIENNGHGIAFDHVDGDLSGVIDGNTIANNAGHGIYFTPTTTNPVPTGDGAPGVPAYAGIPGATDSIDFSAPRNEVQLITFSGVATDGDFTISYTGQNGVTETTAAIVYSATAAQVKAAMVAAFSEIGVEDILVNGNFQDGFEVEFVNAAGGTNVNPLTLDTTNLITIPPGVSITQSTAGNQSEVQFLAVSAVPAFGVFEITFLGQTVELPYTSLNATDLANELNTLANNFVDPGTGTQPFSGTPIAVTAVSGGFEIAFLDGGTMHDLNVPLITFVDDGLNLFVDVEVGPAYSNPNKPADQTIRFLDVFGNNVAPTGGSFTLTFQGETTGPINIDADPAVTAANIDAALQALPSAGFQTGVEGDFIVTGDFANGFVVEFNEIQHLSMIGFNDPTFGSFDLTFLGATTNFDYTVSIPSVAGAQEIEDALNAIANVQGHTGTPVSVNVSGNGYDIIFLDSGSLADEDIPQIVVDFTAMTFEVDINVLNDGGSGSNERHLLDFSNAATGVFPFTFDVNGVDITNPPAGPSFTLTVQGTETQGIVIDTDPAVTAANIDAALESLNLGATGDEFAVTGNYTSGFLITFQGDLANTDVLLTLTTAYPLIVQGTTQVGNFDISSVSAMATNPDLLEPNVTLTPQTDPNDEGIGLNEIQTILFPTAPGGGSYTLDFDGAGPVTLAYDATAADVQAALEGLSSIGAGNVSVTGSAFSGGFDVEFIGDFRAESPGQLIQLDDTNILVVVPTVTTIAEGTTTNEVQRIDVSGTATGGTFDLIMNGVTSTIAYDADAATIIAALVADLPNINAGDVVVRGDALTGFEIEFVGALANTNVSQIDVDSTGLLGGAAMTAKTTTVGGYLRGIRGNTIGGNLGSGIQVELEMYTSFYGDINENTIISNGEQGVNLIAADPTTLKSVDFSLSVDGNTMDANSGAAVAVSMQDTATGDVSITNNTITNTQNDNDATTPYAGDAIYVDLFGTDVSFEAFSQLRDLTIDGNYLGTDVDGTAGLGNSGSGVGIHIEESTMIDRTQISNNVIANNTGDGVNFHREDDARVGRAIVDPIVGEERAVMIYSNTITGNSDGIDILAQNGSLTTTDFEIKDNLITTNLRDGVKLHAEADATILVDIINNQITANTFNGIESTTYTTSYNGTDQRDVGGTWIQNVISNNLQHGVEISGQIGNRDMLFIGLDGVDPVTGADRGNVIDNNGRDGIQIAAFRDRVYGRVKIANNSIQSNATGGIELLGRGLVSSIDNNLIAKNTGKGIDINSNGQVVFLRNNIITENTADGLEILAANSIRHTEDGATFVGNYFGFAFGFTTDTRVTSIGNFIDNNEGRGVDLQTEERANSDVIFGDGTQSGANRIVSNGLEGFYAITTASRGQDQDANSTAALDATGNANDSNADMVLQIDTNYIQDNGLNSNFSSTGLVLRIGTMSGNPSNGSYRSNAPGTDNGTGQESSDGGGGRSNVSVTNNEFLGNLGEDVFIESFTSTVDPVTTQDIWTSPTATIPFRVTQFDSDPLARLNLVFEGNTGNGLDVTNTGAYYDNSEPDFKSRLNNKTAPNPDGPFNSATRRRNAQRVASRTGLQPFGDPNQAPTAVGSIANVDIASPGGPIRITTTSPHGLSPGLVVEIENVFSFDYGYVNPANGVFYIDQVLSPTEFTLRSTDGADLGTIATGTGSWSYNDTNAFLYPGMGASTFRVATGFDDVGNGFDAAASTFYSFAPLGNLFGELSFGWDSWVPDDDSFLNPSTSTFLTADISVAVPDPSTGAITDPLIISFTEDVTGVNINDFILLRDNVAVTLNSSMLSQINARTFELDLSSVTGVDGEYELRLVNDGSISDAKYLSPYSAPANYLMFGDVERFTVDGEAPTAEFEEVSATPINSAAGEVVLNFSEEVTGVDLSDFTLTRDGINVAGLGGNLSSTPATITQVNGSQFILDLSKVTSLSGDYVLTLNANASITDLAGNAMAVDAIEMWTTDTLAPIAQFDNVTDPVAPGPIPGFFVTLNFTEDVSGLALEDFVLTSPDGTTTNLSDVSGTASITTVSASEYRIVLDSLADANGIYTLTYLGEGSAVQDASGNSVAGSASETWQKGTEVIAPTAGIQDITPDPRPSGSAVGVVTINFSEAVTGVNLADFELLFDNGSGQVSISLASTSVVAVNASTYQIDLSDETTADGDYTLNVLSTDLVSPIQDAAGNTLVNVGGIAASDSWRTGGSGPAATIEDLPDVLLSDAGIVSVNFNQSVTGVNIDDFRLTLNGQNVSLAGLSVTQLSSSQYQIDLSTVTQLHGQYTLTLVAAGSNIRNSSTNDPLLDNASESWVASSTLDLTGGTPVFTDGTDTNIGDGVIADSNGDATLRAAIQEANALVGSNVIELAAGTYQLNIGGINEDLSATGDLDIRDNLTIRGQGVGVTIIDGGALDRIFQIFAGVTLNLENLTITNGALTGSDDGAGIRNSGTTTLTNVEVTDNHAEDSAGGINNIGLMVIVDSTISANTAGGSGGGIRNTGTLDISRSTVSGNTTERDGGGLFNAGAGTATITNTTFSGNDSERSGGAIRNTATVTATNNTMTLNSALTNGGAISNSGTFSLQNNLIIGNTATVNPELQGDFTSVGGNLLGVVGTATGFGVNDIVDVADPSLVLDANLADNGGPTLTHALVQGSIAIDAGISANAPALEQRGSTRILGTNIDIGAVEFGAFFVNSTLDTVDVNPGDGIVADADGNITLRAAIMEANAMAGDSVIILGAGTYSLDLIGVLEDVAATGDLDITDTTGSLTIVGAGNGQTIIDASALEDRVFDVRVGADLTLDGVTITGGTAVAESGGGIRNVGTLALVNSVVEGNTADLSGGGILNGELGQLGTMTLTNSIVSGNTAIDGGGIFNNDQSQTTLVDSEVSGNTASGDGGGIYNDLQSTMTITRSTISGNEATLDGGGIYNNDLASLTVNDSKVNNNQADQGAGIFNEQDATLTMSQTTVSGNTSSSSGAGIYNDEGVVTLNDVSILTNTAQLDGGGFYNASAGDVTINNSFFDDNTANRDGGAIANFGVSLTLSGTTLRDSSAVRNGGALYNDQEEGVVSLTSTSIINNVAATGAGIYNQELGNIEIDLSDILNNTASTNGGGIFNTADATITVERTTVDGNQAVNGAGIYNDDVALLNLFDSTLSNNVASGDGGGLYNNSLFLADLVNVTISGNEADNNGGGIFNSEEGSLEITNATVYNNSANSGGGIFNAPGGFVSMANTIVAGNFASTTERDASGGFVTRGNNLIGDETGSTGFVDNVDGDIVGTQLAPVSPGLGALQDNGGATFTHELLGGSLARDAGNNFYAPTDDQRGFARLFDGDGNGSLIVDIGAFESGYIVTGFGDSVDVNPGDGVSVDKNGQSTLRAAIMEANAREGADTILLGTGVYTLSLFGLGENNALLGDLDITDDLTIIGAGSGRTIIDANFLDRIFQIFTDVNVSIRGVTLVNGNVTRVEDGGAILNFGNLSLEDVEIKNSLANRGGALFNNGVVTIDNSEFVHNTAITDGGAIFNNTSGTVSLTVSTIADNNAENGGGIFNASGGTLEVIDTTLDDNSATIAGGGIYNASSVAYGNGEGAGDGTTVEPPTDPQPVSDFTIDVVFTDTSLTTSQQAIFQQAADRWSEIILGDIPDVIIAGIGLIDDLRIEATAVAIDGVNGILGQAGPTWVRPGSFIPATGVMQFDTADLAALEANGELLSVILHEMGHVIGFGTIWENLGLLVGAGSSDPRYVGVNAIAQYNALLGRSVSSIPLENTGGPGTADSHWLETDLVNELMTGYLNSGVDNPISAITIGSLADLGYVVDLSAADTFPSAALQQMSFISTGEMLYTSPEVLAEVVSLVTVEAGSGAVVISNSTISNNFAGTRGGGLLNEEPIELSNVTISGNEAGKEGGGVHNSGEMTVNTTTIYNNTTEGSGGGIYSTALSSDVNIKNTIVAGNTAFVSGSDLVGDFVSQGHNLIGTNNSSTGFIDGFNGDIVGDDAQRIDPLLSALQDNGGPTLTHALLTGSRAIDAGDNTDGVVTDQRGATRPTDTTSDIGAYEIVTPTISVTDVSAIEGDSPDTTIMEFVVSLSNPNIDEITVDYETSNFGIPADSATAGVDYEFTTGTVTFSAGETTQIIRVIIIGDDTPEFHEKFLVNLFNANGGVLGTTQAVGTILNDEATLIVNDSPTDVEEGPDGILTSLPFTISLSHPVTDVVTIQVDSADGTAEGGIDFEAVIGQTITFDPADYAEGEEFTQDFVVQIIGDSIIEDDENLFLNFSNIISPVSTILTPDLQAEGTIVNDDEAVLSIGDATMVEPENGSGPAVMRFTLTLSHPAPSTGLVVDVETRGAITGLPAATATPGAVAGAGADYQEDDGGSPYQATFGVGDTTAFIDIPIFGDLDDAEGTEFFYVEITGTTGAVVDFSSDDDKVGVGTIIEHNEGLVVTTTDDELDAGDQGPGYDPTDLSLREAIQIVNNDSTGTYHTIVLPEGDYHMMISGAGENSNATGDFDILRDLTIVGQGAGITIIDADPDFVDINNPGPLPALDRIFETHGGASLDLSFMELRNGDADDGGAILSQGPTTLDQIIFRNNSADFLGGAILSVGQLDISNALFIDNSAGSEGGAIYQYTDTATVSRTTFEGNTSDGRAGAVYVSSGDSTFPAATFNVSQSLFYANIAGSRGGAIFNDGTVNSTNTTYSGNEAGSRGGAILNNATLNVLNNTLTLNIADQSGGGIFNSVGGDATLVNTIVAGNTGTLGDDDLSGDYNSADSYNNLIGIIGTATGLTDGVQGNIVGTLAASVDPELGVLLNNGGPTRTHQLMVGSPAIDAGEDSLAPGVDQIGTDRFSGSVGAGTDIGAYELEISAAPLHGTEGDSTVVDEQTNIQISVVKNRTSVINGHTAALPGSEDWIDEWDSFWVEVWVDTASGFGISDVLTDIAYNTAYFSATSVEFGSNFNFGRTVVIDDEAGVVRNLGASTIQSDVGGTGYALLARIKFESLEGDQVEVDASDLTVDPLDLGLDIQNTQISVAGVGDVAVSVGALPETDLYPVIYDIDDNDSINFKDLVFFAGAYNQDVINSSGSIAAFDYNKNGQVDFKDLTYLAANYGKEKGGSAEISFPENFGQKWIGDQLEVESGDNTIDEVIDAAVDAWETALDLEEPLEVEVIIQDFGTSQLGSGQVTEFSVDGIPIGGRVVLDDDANGLGWHVDVTDLPGAGVYDLYTVLLHEIGHVLGFTRYYSGFGNLVESDGSGNLTFVGSDFTVELDSAGLHIEDPAVGNDLMNDTLDPGERKTISDINVQMLLESYANATGGSGSVVAAPIQGTSVASNTEPAEPVLIQSTDAARTFVEESTVNLVAPAVIKRSEDDSTADSGISQTATFDAIQPSLFEQDVDHDLDGSLFEDLYSAEFEDRFQNIDTDDRELVFAGSDNDLDLSDEFSLDQESMDDAFTNWEGPLL